MKFKAGAVRDAGAGEMLEAGRREVLEVLEEALRAEAASLAAELSAATGPPSRAAGEAAVKGDARSLFAPPDAVAAVLAGEDKRRAAAWVAEARGEGNTRRLEKILEGTSLAGVPVLDVPDRGQHRAFLRGGHARRGRPAGIVKDKGAWDAWVGELLGAVGSARKGWADAAGDVGGAGKGWQRDGGPRLGGAEVEKTRRRVRVVLRNVVRYAGYLLARAAVRRLVEETRRRVVERMRRGRGF